MYGATHCALASCSSYEDDVHQYDTTSSSYTTPDTQAALATVGSGTKKYLLDDTSTC